MRETKNIEKELLFKNNIKDITSISIDCDYKKNNQKIEGNFIISGEYKIHEISLNKEKFNFKIPFEYKLEEEVDINSVTVDITNFIYDYNKDELIVNIEYEIIGDRNNVLVFDDKESLDDFLNSREVEIIDSKLDDIKCDIIENKTSEEIKKIINEKNDKKTAEIEEKEVNIIGEEERNNISSNEVINNLNSINDDYVTYKIYKIKENDTLENIIIKYKTNIEELKEYNDINNLNINDKIIIPNE